MNWKDKLEYSLSSLSAQTKSNKNILIILSIVIVVFNITFSLSMSVRDSSRTEITENQNLRYIEVMSTGENISSSILDEIRKMDGVSTAFYNKTLSCAIEFSDQGYQAFAVPVDKKDVLALTGKSVLLEENQIILNQKYLDEGLEVGSTIILSYNSKLSEDYGTRENKEMQIVGFYEQPVVNSWIDDVALISQSLSDIIQSELYGVSISEINSENISEDRIIVIVEEIKDTNTIAKAIESNYQGLMTSFALKSSEGLPFFAQAIIIVGGIIVIALIIMSIIVISSTVTNSLKNRFHEIGIIKAIGYQEKDVYQLLLIEITMIAIISIILSLVISFVTLQILNFILYKQNIALNFLKITFIQMLLSTILIFLAMYVSTIKIIGEFSKLDIVEVLRHE